MSTMTVILILYLIGTIALSYVGYLQQKKSNTTANFMSAEQSNGWPSISYTIFGIGVGAAAVVGVTGDTYTTGFFMVLYILLRSMNYMLVGLVGGRQIRRAKSHAAAAYYGAIWGRASGLVYGLLNGFVAAGLVAVTIMGVANLFPVMSSITYEVGLILATLIFLVITVSGGLRSTGLTNVLNTVVMLGGTVLLGIAAIKYGGGVGNIYERAVEVGGPIFEIGNLTGKAPIIILAYILSILPTSACGGPEVLATHSAKSDRDAVLGPVMGGVWMIPMSMFLIIAAYMAVSFFPGEASGSIYYTIAAQVSPIIGGLAVAGVFAANLSSATGLSMGAASVWGWSINELRAMTGKEAMSDKTNVVLSRVLLLFIYAMGYVIATMATSLISMVVNLSSMMACASLLWYFVLYFPKAFRKSSFLATVLSGLAGAVCYLVIPVFQTTFQHIIFPQLIFGIIGWAVSLIVDKRPISLAPLYSEEEQASWTPEQRRFYLREKN